MFKSVIFQRFIVPTGVIVLFAATAFGQDLGSSNSLFRSSNPKTEKKSTPKSNNPAPAKSNSKSSKAVSRKSLKKNRRTSVANNKPVSNKTRQQPAAAENETVINISKATPDNSSEELYEQSIEEGNQARDIRSYPQAEVAYRRAAAMKPNDSRAVYGIGNLYSDQQRWEEAEKAYRQAIALEPNNSDPYVAMSFVLTQPIVGKDLGVRFAEAEQMARKAIQLDGRNPVAYDQLGVALELSGKIGSETQRAYQKAIELDPQFALAYAHLGRLLRRNGKIKESAEAYRKAMQFSTDVPTMILVADVLQSQQRYTDSEQLLRLALQEDSKNPTALFLLGRALTMRGAFDEAEKILKKSVEISPNSFVSYALLGSVYARRGDYSEAEKILNRALRVISENEKKRLAQEFETVGDGFMRLGKKKDAVRVFRQAVALDDEKKTLAEKLAAVQQN